METGEWQVNEPFYDQYAEQSVIGGLLLWSTSDKALVAIEKLKPEDFYLKQHRQFWSAILDMVAKGMHVDLATLNSHMTNAGHEPDFAYLGEIAKNTPSQAGLEGYARQVKDQSKLRKALASLIEAQDSIYEPGDSSERINRALSAVSHIGEDDSEQDFKDIDQLLAGCLDRIENAFNSGGSLVGLSSGFDNIDAMTGGFRPSDLIILAARPSMGKTTLAMNIAENLAYYNERKGKVLVISLEMPASSIIDKSISRAGSIFMNKLSNGQVLDDDQYRGGTGRLSHAMSIIQAGSKNMLIDDRGGQHISQIQARAKRAKMKMGGLDLVVVDYIQLIHADGESQTIRVGNVSRGLKELAKNLGCPVLALSQLNRNIAGRPEMKNLRDSGQIEQDADVIMFLHDDDYEGNRGDHSLTEVIFAKQRMAAIGSTFLQPELQFSRFADTKRLPEPKSEPDQKQKKYSKRFDQ